MDWNKTKSIFIIVFSILNIFLYSLYLNRINDAKNVEILGDPTIEESLKLDNITYGDLPLIEDETSYISARIAIFTDEQLALLQGQQVEIIDESKLLAVLDEPYPVFNEKEGFNFAGFLQEQVLNGLDYELWKIDETQRKALFFQKVNGHPIFYNQNAMLTINWNREGEVVSYEQRMFENFEDFNKKKDLLPPIQAINTLNSRGKLKSDSKVVDVSLGFSTLVQLTKTQVFAPTWFIHVELSNGELNEFFINAIEGKIIEFQSEPIENVVE